MGLIILENKHYIKVNKDGSYIIYKNKTCRNKLKKAPTHEEILKAYAKKMQELSVVDQERLYYDPSTNDLAKEYRAWQEEVFKYEINYSKHITSDSYPLMEQLIPEINLSIPEIVEQGNIGLEAETVDELYAKIKEYDIFGPAEEIKDA